MTTLTYHDLRFGFLYVIYYDCATKEIFGAERRSDGGGPPTYLETSELPPSVRVEVQRKLENV